MSQKLFPVTVVGSWSRPDWLIKALRKRQAEEISSDEFSEIADKAVLEVIKYQEDAGVDILTDGEQRRDNFYSYVVEKLSGMKLMKLSDLMGYVKDRAAFEEVLRGLDVPAFAIKSPIAVDKIKKRNGANLCSAVKPSLYAMAVPVQENRTLFRMLGTIVVRRAEPSFSY